MAPTYDLGPCGCCGSDCPGACCFIFIGQGCYDVDFNEIDCPECGEEGWRGWTKGEPYTACAVLDDDPGYCDEWYANACEVLAMNSCYPQGRGVFLRSECPSCVGTPPESDIHSATKNCETCDGGRWWPDE